MKRKASFFNKTIYYKNIMHFWPVWSIYLLLLLIWVPYSIWNLGEHHSLDNILRYNSYSVRDMQNMVNLRIYNAASIWIWFHALFALVCALIVFRYLFTRRDNSAFHALPVTRTCHFVSNTLSGLTMLLLPQLIVWGISMIAVGFIEYGSYACVIHTFLLIGCYSFIFYSIAVLCITLCGHLVSTVLIFAVINSIFLLAGQIINLLTNAFSFGMFSEKFSDALLYLSPFFYLLEKLITIDTTVYYINGTPAGLRELFLYLTVLGFFGLLSLVVSALLYRRRKLENGIAFLAFRRLNLPGWIILTLYSTSALVHFFNIKLPSFVYITQSRLLLLSAVSLGSSVLLAYIFQMLIYKSIHIFKKGLKGTAIYCGSLVLILLCFGFALSSSSSYIPAVSDILQVSLKDAENGTTVLLTDSDSISSFTSLHNQILKEKETIVTASNNLYKDRGTSYNSSYPIVSSGKSSDYYEFSTYNYNAHQYLYYLRLDYQLKNGRTIKRIYTIPVFSVFLSDKYSDINYINKLQKILTTPRYVEQALEIYEKTSETDTPATIRFHYINNNESTIFHDLFSSRHRVFNYDNDSDYYMTGDLSYVLTKKEAALVYQAALSDLKSGSLLPYNSLDLRSATDSCIMTLYFDSSKRPGEETVPPYRFVMSSNCANIIRAIQSFGSTH